MVQSLLCIAQGFCWHLGKCCCNFKDSSVKLSSANTLYTIPILSASSAVTLSPSIISAEAFCQPINRGRKKVPPLSGINPIFENACMKEADSGATTTSQQKAMLAPAPAATPFTAATTGFFNLLICA